MMDNQKILDWYQKELEKDSIQIENDKKKFANSIKKLKKQDIFISEKTEKLTIWKRIKKVLMGI
jgi:hypothetical protein